PAAGPTTRTRPSATEGRDCSRAAAPGATLRETAGLRALPCSALLLAFLAQLAVGRRVEAVEEVVARPVGAVRAEVPALLEEAAPVGRRHPRPPHPHHRHAAGEGRGAAGRAVSRGAPSPP